jgi:DUF917 family protein
MTLEETNVEKIIYGAGVLSGGGGGSIAVGLDVGRRALAAGKIDVIDLAQLDDNAVLATVSVVGPVDEGGMGRFEDSFATHSLELFSRTVETEINGLVPSEVGAWAIAYSWLISAMTGIPIVDAPCNGRAHPASIMGSLGLHLVPGYVTAVSAVGGDQEAGTYLALAARGPVEREMQFVRSASASHGLLAVIRNPTSAGYIRENAAVGALQQAQLVGEALLTHLPKGFTEVAQAIADILTGRVTSVGQVKSVDLSEKGGFTVGSIWLDDGSDGNMQVLVCNEYMMALHNESPVAVFPDLIVLLDETTNLPMLSTAVEPGRRVALLTVPRDRLNLASTMDDRSLLRPIEELLGMQFPT